jgi:hypothetical protein
MFCVGALTSALGLACGSSASSQGGQTGGCAPGQVPCTGCGSGGFCAVSQCPAVTCPAPSDGGGADGSLQSGACPVGQAACSDCSGGTLCIVGGCGAVQCPPPSLDAAAGAQDVLASEESSPLAPCGDGGCAAPNYCFLLACGGGAPIPDAAPCAEPAPVCAPLPADCADSGNSFVHNCPSGAGIFYCGMVNWAARTVPCGFQ